MFLRVQDVNVNDRRDLVDVCCCVHGLAEGIICKICTVTKRCHCLLRRVCENRLIHDCGRISGHVDWCSTDDHLNGAVACDWR